MSDLPTIGLPFHARQQAVEPRIKTAEPVDAHCLARHVAGTGPQSFHSALIRL